MNKWISFFLAFAFITTQTGCATIVSGRTQDVMIRSNPSGAKVTIDEVVSGTTPMVANLLRKKRHQVSITKNEYTEVTQATTRGFNWWYIGNILFGGIIGLIVDPITGSIFDIEPAEINVTLPKEEPTVVSPAATAALSATNTTTSNLPQIQEKASAQLAEQPKVVNEAIVTEAIQQQLLEPTKK